MITNLSFRPAHPSDASDLAVLFDAAARRLMAWFWSLHATKGQSWFEVGRNRIRNNTTSDSHFTNWQVATVNDEVVGALCSLRLSNPYDPGDLSNIPAATMPFIELEAVGKGTYYVFVASVFPEYRGNGVGTAILDKATELARAATASRLTLIVESFNPDAKRLYERYGFREWDRRPFIPFPGCDDEGDLILMVKDVTN